MAITEKMNLVTQLLPAVRIAYPEIYHLDYERLDGEEYCVVYVNHAKGKEKAAKFRNYKICITADSSQSALIDITKGLAKILG